MSTMKILGFNRAAKRNPRRAPIYFHTKNLVKSSEAAPGEERNGHVSPTSEFFVLESLAALFADEQGTDALTTSDEILVPNTGEERRGLAQIPAASSATHVTREVQWEEILTMVEKLGEELRKERQQRQELEERLKNETEHLKRKNQQLEESLQNEQAKVEQLEVQIQRNKQENQQMMVQLRDGMKALLAGSS